MGLGSPVYFMEKHTKCSIAHEYEKGERIQVLAYSPNTYPIWLYFNNCKRL